MGARRQDCVPAERQGMQNLHVPGVANREPARTESACAVLRCTTVAKHFSDLVAWQLGDEIRQHVLRWTDQPPFSGDFKRKAQIEDAIDSVCRNIAEGFSGSHAEFVRYLKIARRSLNEVMDCTRSAQLKRYISAEEAAAVASLSRRLYPAMSRLADYLTRTPDPPPKHRRPSRAPVATPNH
jgi:four helix bundle protein